MDEESKIELKARLESRKAIDPEAGCWYYVGALVSDGYGQLSYKGQQLYVHRASAAVYLDFDLTSSLYVCHHCDQPPCFNPDHLFPGTPRDNVRDAVSKGRMTGKKLNVDQVIDIKRRLAAGETQRSISGKYGVSTTAIGQISRRETWKQVLLSIAPDGEDGSLGGEVSV